MHTLYILCTVVDGKLRLSYILFEEGDFDVDDSIRVELPLRRSHAGFSDLQRAKPSIELFAER